MDVLRNAANFVTNHVTVTMFPVFVMAAVKMERKGVIVKRVGTIVYLVYSIYSIWIFTHDEAVPFSPLKRD